MGELLAHRGPNGRRTWINADGTAGFSHTRLCVIDTTEAASQPMHYLERYTIVYNGEIYNYIELRDVLSKQGFQFSSASDTEVVLAAYVHYREKCVEHFDGMFAFALWDDEEETLFCARDRFGEKPFYYNDDDGFTFASEIKALFTAGVDNATDDGMLLHFFGTGRTVDPTEGSRTFYSDIKKLPAAHWLKFDLQSDSVTVQQYWDVSKTVHEISLKDALARLDELLTVSVKRRLRSDVPLGTSLSGGLDSSAIASTIARLGVDGLKTFTAAFPGFEKDEAARARSVAQHLGFANYMTEPTADDLADNLGKLAYYHDEPIGSASVYAQFKVFELAANHGVTVLLDGQGADEILAGYDHYRKWKLRSYLPEVTAAMLESIEKGSIAHSSINREFLAATIGDVEVVKPVVRQLNDILYFDVFRAGLEQLLRYADRNSMAHGREVRLPFLNHELVDFAFGLKADYKINDGYTKWLLRKLMTDKLAHETVWVTRKTGFEPPQKAWMETGRMKEYLTESKKELVRMGILDKAVLNQRPSSNEAFEKHAHDWRWMAASAFIQNKKGV